MDVLKRIQNKSSNTKSKYSFVIAGIFTVAIALVWASTLPARFDTITQQTTETSEETKGSLSDILEEANNQAASVGSLEDEMKKQIETSSLDALNFATQDEMLNISSTTTDTSTSTSTTTIEDIDIEEVDEEPETEVLEEEVATTTPETIPEEPRTILIEIKETEDPSISEEDITVE